MTPDRKPRGVERLLEQRKAAEALSAVASHLIAKLSANENDSNQKRANENAEQESTQVGVSNAEVIAAKYKEPSSKDAKTQGNKKNGRYMGLREIVKPISVTDVLLTAFTFALAVLAYYQWRTSNSQLFVMKNDERAWIRVSVRSSDTGKIENIIPSAGSHSNRLML